MARGARREKEARKGGAKSAHAPAARPALGREPATGATRDQGRDVAEALESSSVEAAASAMAEKLRDAYALFGAAEDLRAVRGERRPARRTGVGASRCGQVGPPARRRKRRRARTRRVAGAPRLRCHHFSLLARFRRGVGRSAPDEALLLAAGARARAASSRVLAPVGPSFGGPDDGCFSGQHGGHRVRRRGRIVGRGAPRCSRGARAGAIGDIPGGRRCWRCATVALLVMPCGLRCGAWRLGCGLTRRNRALSRCDQRPSWPHRRTRWRCQRRREIAG